MRTLKKMTSLLLVTCSLGLALTGCGNNDKGSTSGNNDNNVVEDAADNVGNAVEDVADGVGNAVDDLVGTNGFDNYEDAKTYLMQTMEEYHPDMKFEIRDEDKNLTDYQEGSKGYRFRLYDTSKDENGELFGEFYVDANSGVIYRMGDNETFEEYRGKETTTNGTDGTSSTSEGTTNNKAKSGNDTNGTGAGNTNGKDAGDGTNTTGDGATDAGQTTGGNAGSAQ